MSGTWIEDELRQTVAQLVELTERRDQLIRDALAAEVSAKDVATAAGLSVQRVYQIRDGRR